MSDDKHGLVVTITECGRCRMILAPEAARNDCPTHALSCCGAAGGHGAMHAVGCEQDPMFKAGQRYAYDREKAAIDAILG